MRVRARANANVTAAARGWRMADVGGRWVSEGRDIDVHDSYPCPRERPTRPGRVQGEMRAREAGRPAVVPGREEEEGGSRMGEGSRVLGAAAAAEAAATDGQGKQAAGLGR